MTRPGTHPSPAIAVPSASSAAAAAPAASRSAAGQGGLPGSSGGPRPDGRYIKASEVGTYLFCHRAWRFERDGAPSSREPERAVGSAHHVRHGERVTSAARTGRMARGCLVLGIALLLLGLWAAPR